MDNCQIRMTYARGHISTALREYRYGGFIACRDNLQVAQKELEHALTNLSAQKLDTKIRTR